MITQDYVEELNENKYFMSYITGVASKLELHFILNIHNEILLKNSGMQ